MYVLMEQLSQILDMFVAFVLTFGFVRTFKIFTSSFLYHHLSTCSIFFTWFKSLQKGQVTDKSNLRKRKVQLCVFQNRDFHKSIRLLFVIKSECKVGFFGRRNSVENKFSEARERSLLICSLACCLYFMALQHLSVGILQQVQKSCKNCYLTLYIN